MWVNFIMKYFGELKVEPLNIFEVYQYLDVGILYCTHFFLQTNNNLKVHKMLFSYF